MTTVGADNFANATHLPFGSSSDPTPTASLTMEPGEPQAWGGQNQVKSAWWQVTVPTDLGDTVTVNFDLLQSTILGTNVWGTDTVLTVYTGDSLSSLTSLGSFDDPQFSSYTSYLSEGELDLAAGITVYVQATVYNSSDDTEYVLRVAPVQYVTGEWTQRPDYTAVATIGGTSPNMSRKGNTFSASASVSGSRTDAAYNAAFQAAYGGSLVANSSAMPGFIAAADTSPDVTTCSYAEYCHAYQLHSSLFADTAPVDDSHYDYETQSSTSTLVSLVAHIHFQADTAADPYLWSVSSTSPGSDAVSGHGAVVIVDKPDVLYGSFPNWDPRSMNTVATVHEQDIAPGTSDVDDIYDIDVTAWLVNNTFAFKSINSLPVVQGCGGAWSEGIGVQGGCSDATATLHPPLIRYIDRVLEPYTEVPKGMAGGPVTSRRAFSHPRRY